MGQAAGAYAGLMFMSYMLQRYEARSAARKQRAATELSYQRWLKHAYPSAETVAAKKKSGLSTLAIAREEAEARIGSSLAARGFGPGSGAMPEAYEEVEKGYLQSVGKFESDITQWEGTPYGAIPSAAYPTGQYFSSTGTLQQALGMYSAMQMYRSIYGGGGNLGYNPYTMYSFTGGGPGGAGSGLGGYTGFRGGAGSGGGYGFGSYPSTSPQIGP